MRYAPQQTPICEVCALQAMYDANSITKQCERCKTDFCPHFSSQIDFNYCGNCMTEINVTVYKQRDCKTFKIDGVDFFFAQQTIHQLSDIQLEKKIEYHGAMLSGLMIERADRKVERQKNLPKVKLMARPVAVDDTGAIIPQKQRTARKAQNPMNAAIMAVLGPNATQAQIDAFTKFVKATSAIKS